MKMSTNRLHIRAGDRQLLPVRENAVQVTCLSGEGVLSCTTMGVHEVLETGSVLCLQREAVYMVAALSMVELVIWPMAESTAWPTSTPKKKFPYPAVCSLSG